MRSCCIPDTHLLHKACLAHTPSWDGEKLNSVVYTAKCYSSYLMFAPYIACQIRHACNIGNYMLQAGELHCEVYLDANETSGKSLCTMPLRPLSPLLWRLGIGSFVMPTLYP